MYRVIRGRAVPPLQKSKDILVTFNDTDDESGNSEGDSNAKGQLQTMKQQCDRLKRKLQDSQAANSSSPQSPTQTHLPEQLKQQLDKLQREQARSRTNTAPPAQPVARAASPLSVAPSKSPNTAKARAPVKPAALTNPFNPGEAQQKPGAALPTPKPAAKPPTKVAAKATAKAMVKPAAKAPPKPAPTDPARSTTAVAASLSPPLKKRRTDPSMQQQSEVERELSRKEQAVLNHCRVHARSMLALAGQHQQQERLRLEERQIACRLQQLKNAYLEVQEQYLKSREKRLAVDRRYEIAERAHAVRTSERNAASSALSVLAKQHPTLCHVATAPAALRFLAVVRERAAAPAGGNQKAAPSAADCEALLALEEKNPLLTAVWDCGDVQWLEPMGAVGSSVYAHLRRVKPWQSGPTNSTLNESPVSVEIAKLTSSLESRPLRCPGDRYSSPLPITSRLKVTLTELQGPQALQGKVKDANGILCPFEMLGHCNDDACPNLHMQDWPATDHQLMERIWSAIEQRYDSHPNVIETIQQQRERCAAYGTMGLHLAFIQTLKLLEDLKKSQGSKGTRKRTLVSEEATKSQEKLLPSTVDGWISWMIQAARSEVKAVPPELLPVAPLRPSSSFLGLAKQAVESVAQSLDRVPGLLLRIFLNSYVSNHMQDMQLRERNTKGWLLKVFDQLLLKHPYNVQLYCLYLEVLSRNCPALLTMDLTSKTQLAERKQVPPKFTACIKGCVRVLDVAIAKFSELNRSIEDKSSQGFVQLSQKLLYFVGQKCLLLLKDGRHVEVAQYLRTLISEAAETSALTDLHLATVCSLFFGILGTGTQAGLLQMAGCLTGSVLICWDSLLDESSEFLNDLDAIFETMKMHQRLLSGKAELLMLANHVRFLKACGKLDPPLMRTMLHGYLRKTSENASGWPFYVQMEFSLGQDEDGFHVCEELLGMYHSNVFFFYFYARSLVEHRKCDHAIAVLRECIIQYRMTPPDAAPEDELLRLQTLRQAVKEASTKETIESLLLYYEQELEADSAVVQPWIWDSNRLFLGLCYLLLCCLEGQRTRCLDGFACLLDKCYGCVDQEQHWGSTQLIIWEYLQAMLYFNTNIDEICRATLRSLRYIVCHNMERDLAASETPIEGVVVDDILHGLQLMLGSSHSPASDFTFFNSIMRELIQYAPAEKHSHIYREAIALDGRNHALRWRWAKHEQLAGNVELAHELCRQLFSTSFLDFLPLCPTSCRELSSMHFSV